MMMTEPTSGLDSHTSCNIIQLLKKMAEGSCAVLLTIHQPSSELFAQFDMVVFVREGRIFYQGPVDNVVPHFAAHGYQCPQNYNPCDYVMSLIQVESTEALEKSGVYMLPPGADGDRSRSSSIDFIVSDKPFEIAVGASFCRQLGWLLHREYLNVVRDKAALGARFGITIFLNVLFGLIFLNSGGRNNGDFEAFATHQGAIMMVTISTMFGSAQPAMLQFPFERPMFMREYSTGTCE